jgi:hypothetical protein
MKRQIANFLSRQRPGADDEEWDQVQLGLKQNSQPEAQRTYEFLHCSELRELCICPRVTAGPSAFP